MVLESLDRGDERFGTVTRIARPARHRPRVAPQVGPPGRDRPRPARRHHQRGRPAHRRAGAGGPRAAAGQRDPQERIGFLRGGARPPIEAMTRYIDAHRDIFGVEPICQVLEVAPSTYYAARSRPPSARAVRGRGAEARDRPGPRRELRRSTAPARCGASCAGRASTWAVTGSARLMGELGLAGPPGSRRVRTTFPAPVAERPADLVDRVFSAAAPDRLWVADLTYVWTALGLLLRGLRHRRLQPAHRGLAGLLIAAHRPRPRRARDGHLSRRGDRALAGLVHHSDRGIQYLSIRYTERLAEAGVVNSVGSRGDSLRQRPGRDRQRPLQGRADPPAGSLAERRGRRARHRRAGSTGGTRSVSTPPAATCRRPSTRRHTGPTSRWWRPPEPYRRVSTKPVRFSCRWRRSPASSSASGHRSAVRSGGPSEAFEVGYMRGLVSFGLLTVVAALAPVTLGGYGLTAHEVWVLSSLLVLVGYLVVFAVGLGHPSIGRTCGTGTGERRAGDGGSPRWPRGSS